jgi:hypothetical protein
MFVYMHSCVSVEELRIPSYIVIIVILSDVVISVLPFGPWFAG